MKRIRLRKRANKRNFARTANKVHVKNLVNNNIPRGGIRL